MAIRIRIAIVFVAMFCVRAFAADCSSSLPKQIEEQISAEKAKGWTVVSLNDLPQDDQLLWQENHREQCPGIADGRFIDNGVTSYAVAFIKHGSNEQYMEKLTVFSPAKSGSGSSQINLVKPSAVVSPFVVWKVPPGKYSGIGGGPAVSVSNESFVYEKMEAVATQYYFLGGRFHALTTAD